jgi:hypothetical protein
LPRTAWLKSYSLLISSSSSIGLGSLLILSPFPRLGSSCADKPDCPFVFRVNYNQEQFVVPTFRERSTGLPLENAPNRAEQARVDLEKRLPPPRNRLHASRG